VHLKDIINHIVNEYVKFEKLFEDYQGYDLDDYDDHYRVWLDGIAKKIEKMIKDKDELQEKEDTKTWTDIITKEVERTIKENDEAKR